MNARNMTVKPDRTSKAKGLGWTEAPVLAPKNPMLDKYSVVNKAGQVVCVVCGHPPAAHDKVHRCIVFYDAGDEEDRMETNLARLGTQRFRMGSVGGKLRRSEEDFQATEDAQETRYGGPTRVRKVVASARGVDHHFIDGSISRADWQ